MILPRYYMQGRSDIHILFLVSEVYGTTVGTRTEIVARLSMNIGKRERKSRVQKEETGCLP